MARKFKLKTKEIAPIQSRQKRVKAWKSPSFLTMPRISLRQRGISPNVQEHVSGQETGTSLQMALLNQTKPTK